MMSGCCIKLIEWVLDAEIEVELIKNNKNLKFEVGVP